MINSDTCLCDRPTIILPSPATNGRQQSTRIQFQLSSDRFLMCFTCSASWECWATVGLRRLFGSSTQCCGLRASMGLVTSCASGTKQESETTETTETTKRSEAIRTKPKMICVYIIVSVYDYIYISVHIYIIYLYAFCGYRTHYRPVPHLYPFDCIPSNLLAWAARGTQFRW